MILQPDLESQLLQGLNRLLVTKLGRLLLGHQYKVAAQQPCALGHAVLARSCSVDLVQVDGQARLDSKDGVCLFVGVTAEVERTWFFVSGVSDVCCIFSRGPYFWSNLRDREVTDPVEKERRKKKTYVISFSHPSFSNIKCTCAGRQQCLPSFSKSFPTGPSLGIG